MKRIIRNALLGGSLATIIIAAAPAFAQDTTAPADAPVTTNSGDIPTAAPTDPQTAVQPAGPPAQLDDPDSSRDIIVTAQKREQSINDVGLAVTAVSGDALMSRQINNVQDLAAVIPGLSFTQSGTNTPVYTLRGVGFYETTLAAYPDVSIYVDEVPLPFPVMTTNSGFDLERVEVLKGPQGTLFGNNATGGAINYIAAKPTESFEAGITAGYGRFDTVTGEAFVSGPLTNTLKARIAGKVVHSGDWQRGYTNDRTTGATRSYAGRLLLDWEPTNAIHLQLNVNGWQDDSDPQAEQYIQYRPNVPTPPGTVLAIESYPYAPEDPRAADFGPVEPFGDRTFLQAALRADIDITDNVTLTSLTSYIDYKRNTAFDGDGTTLADFDVTSSVGTIKSFSQELRLAQSTGQFRWVIGGNYSRDETFEEQILSYSASTVANNGSGLTGASGYRDAQLMKNYAGFANAEFDVGRLTFKAGVRYTQADRDDEGCGFDIPGGGTAELFTFLQNLQRGATGQAPGPNIAPGACFTIDNIARDGNIPTFLGGVNIDELNENNTSFRAGIDYKPNSDLLLFANITKGYKAGSFSSIAAATALQYLPVVQESVLSYEGGVKATLLDGDLQANGGVFYYDYKNKQVKSKLLDPVFGVIDALVNVPKSHVFGVELELVAHPARGFNVYTNFLYLKTEIDDFSGYGGDGVLGTFDGGRLPFSPEYAVTSGFDYSVPITDTLNMFGGADVSLRSDTSAIIGENPLYDIDDYVTLDLRAGIESPDKNWRFQIWGKNVFNEYYWTSVVSYYDTVARYAGRPAEYGASVSYKF